MATSKMSAKSKAAASKSSAETSESMFRFGNRNQGGGYIRPNKIYTNVGASISSDQKKRLIEIVFYLGDDVDKGTNFTIFLPDKKPDRDYKKDVRSFTTKLYNMMKWSGVDVDSIDDDQEFKGTGAMANFAIVKIKEQFDENRYNVKFICDKTGKFARLGFDDAMEIYVEGEEHGLEYTEFEQEYIKDVAKNSGGTNVGKKKKPVDPDLEEEEEEEEEEEDFQEPEEEEEEAEEVDW